MFMASIQGIYIALFERPADPGGLAFFNGVTKNGADLTQIGDLSGQKEYLDRFTGQSSEQIVRSIYKSLFNRDAEQAGVDFFVGRLQRGEININTVAINILDGAQGQDLTIVNNKIAAANAFTTAINTNEEIAGYKGDTAAQAGRDFIRTVTTSVPDQATTDAAVAKATGTQVPGGGGGPGSPTSVTLTADVETKTATTFSAPLINQGGNQVQSLNSGDNLIGSGTNTKLDASLNGSEAGGTKPKISGVSTINLTSVGAAANIFDAANVQGATSFTSVDSKQGLTINNIGAGATVGITNLQAGNFDHTFRFVDSSTAGAADTATLKLNGAGANATAPTQIDISLVGQTTGGFETINVDSTGAPSRV